MNVFRRAHDPWWDLEGRGQSAVASATRSSPTSPLRSPIVACGITAAAWLLTLAPVVGDLGLG